MQNWFAANEVQQFTVSFYMKKHSDGPFVEGMLNNADCLEKSTFEVTNDLVGS